MIFDPKKYKLIHENKEDGYCLYENLFPMTEEEQDKYFKEIEKNSIKIQIAESDSAEEVAIKTKEAIDMRLK